MKVGFKKTDKKSIHKLREETRRKYKRKNAIK